MSAPESKTGEAKPMSASRVTLSQLMQPEHANSQGSIHGGWIMKLADEAGALAAMRHARNQVVTVAIDQMSFQMPIRLGDLVMLEAEVTYVGRSSMETRVRVVAENPISGERTHTNTAYIVYVALDEDGKPCPVPGLIAETEAEAQRLKRGSQRQKDRLTRQRRELQDQGP